ncbi:MAG: asparagine synthase (glutamine-hydrolyzing), partial [Clostridia bacterium]|nr:asparagine synthase (glutamine-hydrolyzing) [Clostridia bacterium]
MCSIAGKINLERDIRDENGTFLRIQNTLLKRGPDDRGILAEKHASLIHTRLAVIDIENGKQPMEIEHYIIVYNGELYNTEEIRAELKSYGITFTGHSDTEVLLKAYIKWKEKCIEKFNGIFAFAIWDKKEEKLFIARDRIGVKPFFFYNRNGEFIFASEIKGILASGAVEAEANLNSISELILLGPGRTQGQGVFRNIEELPPATCGYFDRNGLKTWKYWHLEDNEHSDNLKTTIEKVRFLVTDAIKRQLVSDVPVCTFLSGGLDSSIISSIADKYFTEKGEMLHTFSLDYKDNDIYFKESKFQPNSDSTFIRIMQGHLNGENHIIKLDTDELVSALFDAVDARDLPGMADVDSSLLLFCKEIKKQGTVALSGECADEIFGGYPWYRDRTIREIEGFPWAQSTAYRYKFLKKEFAEKINPTDFIHARYKQTIDNADTSKTKPALDRRMKEMMRLNLDWFMQT